MDTQVNINPIGSAEARRAELTRHARVWVAQTFYGTLFRQMESSPFRSEMFGGGRGGQVFSSLFHQHLSQRMAGGTKMPLVDSIVKRIARANPGLLDPAPDPVKVLNENVRKHVAPGAGT